MIVLDTHVWLWWVSNPENLSSAASESINLAVQENSVYISSISVWEAAMLVRKGRLQLSIEIRDWVRKSEALPFINFVPVDNTIALRSVNLPGDFHDDPADRLIVATAMTLGGKLITKDKKILQYEEVQTVW